MVFFLKYFLLHIFILFFTIVLSKKLGFYDSPGKRKVHKTKIINTSGVSIYIYFILISLYCELDFHIEQIIFVGFFALLCGFVDDRIGLAPSQKILLLIFPALYLILNGFQLDDLGNYSHIGTIKLGKFGIIFTLFACCLLINGCNFIDGIDGLLLSNFLSSIFYLIFLIHVLEIPDQNLILEFLYLIIIPLAINITLNFLPSNNQMKIFLGDTGSLFLGFFLSFLIIYFYKFKNIHPAYLIWICWFPVYDLISVTLSRVLEKKNFLYADNNHMHHILLVFFKNSHLKTTTLISIINILIIIQGYFITKTFGEHFSLLTFIIFFIIFHKVKNVLLFKLNKNK
jgi:UDP-GlcNAc:undecaprenyl-phosphate GlcNAc-1-phosphate transferase